LPVDANGAFPRALQRPSRSYDPDGPWHAIRVQIRTHGQWVDLFPWGFWFPNILSTSL
ncbi:hypothetical protein F5882DRAFT_302654, partial [Hyaloscypha sp. PMI_1271]